jgi:hypothetical protein
LVFLGFSLSVLSLFKDLRGPPGPENIFDPLSTFRGAEPERRMRRRAPAMRLSSLALDRPMWLMSFIAWHYAGAFDFGQVYSLSWQ